MGDFKELETINEELERLTKVLHFLRELERANEKMVGSWATLNVSLQKILDPSLEHLACYSNASHALQSANTYIAQDEIPAIVKAIEELEADKKKRLH